MVARQLRGFVRSAQLAGKAEPGYTAASSSSASVQASGDASVGTDSSGRGSSTRGELQARPTSKAPSFARLTLLFNHVFILALTLGFLGLLVFYAIRYLQLGLPLPWQFIYIMAAAGVTVICTLFLIYRNSSSVNAAHGAVTRSGIDCLLLALWGTASGLSVGSCTVCRYEYRITAICAVLALWSLGGLLLDVLLGRGFIKG